MKKRSIFWKRRATFLLAAVLLVGEISGATVTVQATNTTQEIIKTEESAETVPVPKEYISLNGEDAVAMENETAKTTETNQENNRKAEETIPVIKPAEEKAVSDDVNAEKEASHAESQAEEITMPETIPVIGEAEVETNVVPAAENKAVTATVTTPAAITADTNTENVITVGSTISRDAATYGYDTQTEKFIFTPEESGYYGMILRKSESASVYSYITIDGNITGKYLNSNDTYLDSVVVYLEGNQSYTWNLQYSFLLSGFWDPYESNSSFECEIVKADEVSVSENTIGGSVGELSAFYHNTQAGLLQITLTSEGGYDYYVNVYGADVKLTNGQTTSVLVKGSGRMKFTLWKNSKAVDNVKVTINTAEVVKGAEGNVSTISISDFQMPSGGHQGSAILSFTPDTDGYYAFVNDLNITGLGYCNASVYEYVSEENFAYLTNNSGNSKGNNNLSVIAQLTGGKTYYYCVSLTEHSQEITYADTASVYIKAVSPQNITMNQATEVVVQVATLYETSLEKGKFYEVSLSGTNNHAYQVGITSSAYCISSFANGLYLFTNKDDKAIFYSSADCDVQLDIFAIDNPATSKTVTLQIKEYAPDELTLNQETINEEKLSKNNTLIKKFTPTESGTYSFFGMNYTKTGYWDSIGVSTIDEDGTLKYIYGTSSYYLEFDAQCELEAGKTYYLINYINGNHEAEVGDYIVGITKAETYNISFVENATEVTSDISMYKSANVKFNVPEKGFYQLVVNGEADSYEFFYDYVGYVLYSGIGKLFYFEEPGEYTLKLSREVTKESGIDKVSLTIKKGEGLLELKELVSDEEQNQVELSFDDSYDFKWGEFIPAETGNYVILTFSGVSTYLYHENEDEGCLKPKAFLLNSGMGGGNQVATLEKNKHYYFKFIPNGEWEGQDYNIRIISVPMKSISGNNVSIDMDTNHSVLVNYQAEKDGIYNVLVTGKKKTYALDNSQNTNYFFSGERYYFFCSEGANTFYIAQNDNSYEADTINFNISNVATDSVSKEITMTDKTVWIKYSPEQSGKYTWGSIGASGEDLELDADLYMQTSEDELSYVSCRSRYEGADFRSSTTFEKGYNYYIKITSNIVPNAFNMYVNLDETAEMNLAEETELTMEKTVWAELDVSKMKVGFYKVSVIDDNENQYDVSFNTTLSTGKGNIMTPNESEATIYLTSKVRKKAKKAKEPVTVQITRNGAPVSGTVKVRISKIETEEQALVLNEVKEVEGTSNFDCYTFTTETGGDYQLQLNGIKKFYLEDSGSVKQRTANKYYYLQTGNTYKFYVQNTNNVPYSVCLRKEENIRVYDYDSYQAFIASGGTINIMNYSDIPDEAWNEDEECTTADYQIRYLNNQKWIVMSTKDFTDTDHKWFLEYSDNISVYAPISDYSQINQTLSKQKYVGRYTDIVPKGYAYKNLCDENGNLISADTALENPYMVLAKYGPEYVLIQNITLQGVNALKPGDTATLKANISTGNDYAPTDSSVTWTSSDKNIVTVDNQGNIKAVKAGTATITCTANDQLHKSASLKVTVTENVVYAAKVTISGSNSVNVGESITLKATIDTNGKGKPSRDGVTWTSSNASVAAVNESGIVTGIKAGTAVITATSLDGKAKAHYTITVKNVEAKKIALNESKITMKYGTTYKWLTVAFTPKNTTNKKLTWKSSNTKVAIVTSSGKIKAKGVGEATITVKSSNGKKDTLKVTVSKYDIKTKKVKLPSKKTVQEGDKVKLSLEFTPVNATNQKVKWESSDESVATVNSKGVVTAKKAGKATITATTKDGTKKTAKCKITVKELSQIKGLKVVSESKGTVKLTWNEVEGASGYQIYMATSKKGKYKKIGTTKAGIHTFTKKGLKGKKKYYFKVVAFKKNNGKQYEGKYSAVKNVTIKK